MLLTTSYLSFKAQGRKLALKMISMANKQIYGS